MGKKIDAFAAAGNAFMDAYQQQLTLNQKREQAAQEAAWVNEQRGRQRQDWQRQDQVRSAMAGAMAPRGASDTAYDQQIRGADAIQAIDPMEATRLRSNAIQTEGAKLQLSKAQADQLNETFNNDLLRKLADSDTWFNGAAGVLSQATGKPISAVPSKDGKSVTFYADAGDGQRTPIKTLDAGSRGYAEFLAGTARLDSKTKLTILHNQMQADIADRQRQEDRDYRTQERAQDFENRKQLIGIEHGLRMKERAASGSGGPTGQPIIVTGPNGQPMYARMQGNKLVPMDMGGMAIAPKGRQQTLDPKDYAATVKGFVESGIPLARAQMQADELYGRAPAGPTSDAGLLQENAAREKAAAPAKPAPRAIPPAQTSQERLRSLYIPTRPQMTDEEIMRNYLAR